jgi:starch-binding outer membrane protein, SusD/RagB family
VWRPLSVARASADRVLNLIGTAPGADRDINVARAALFAGFSMLDMADMFCVGTISTPDNQPGPPLNTQEMLNIAVERFTRAHAVGTAAGGAVGTQLANAALVGRARAHLQAGRNAQALQDANAVAPGFVFNLPYVDDVGNRTRLGNRMWSFTADRGSIGVAPAYQVGDPRVPFLAPGTHNFVAFEGPDQPIFAVQQKYPSYAAPIRLASRLEADYIAAEAQGTAAMLALIQARRAANNRPAYTGGTDAESVLREFLVQRAFEFYLENRKIGDLRRHPQHTPFVPQPGPYFKPGYGAVQDQVCLPLPQAETDNNPNFD